MQAKLSPICAHWHEHVNHVHAPAAIRHWLADRGSLTAKLIAHSKEFQVQRVYQQADFSWADEFAAIGLPRIAKVHTREVLLRCDGMPAVYAHTILPLNSNASQWPLFRTLGNKSLGSTLFGDPQVKRGQLHFARLQPNHPAMQRARLLLQREGLAINVCQSLFARRSLFHRRGGVMLVTELFLPSVAQLRRTLVSNTN